MQWTKTMTIVAFALTLGMNCGWVFAQNGELDQESPWTNAGFNLSASSLTWQQQIKAGVSGVLEGLVLPITGPAGAQFDVKLRLGPAWSEAEPRFEDMITKQSSGLELIFIDMTSSQIKLDAGDKFVMELRGNNTSAGIRGSKANPPLYPEPLWLNRNPFSDGEWRLGFRTYMLAGGGGKCNYKIKKSKAKGGCEACPAKGDGFETEKRCEQKSDCRKRVKTKINCPEGKGACKIKAKKRRCE